MLLFNDHLVIICGVIDFYCTTVYEWLLIDGDILTAMGHELPRTLSDRWCSIMRLKNYKLDQKARKIVFFG